MEKILVARCYRSTTVFKHPGVPELDTKKKKNEKKDKTVTFIFHHGKELSVLRFCLWKVLKRNLPTDLLLRHAHPFMGFVLMGFFSFCLLSVTNPVRRVENVLTL